MVILSNNMKFLSHECSMPFCSLTKYNDNPPMIRLYTRTWPSHHPRTFTDLWEVSIEHLRRVYNVACWQGTLTPPDTWTLPFFRLTYFLLVETNCFSKLSLFFRTMLFELPLVLFRLCFARKYRYLTFFLYGAAISCDETLFWSIIYYHAINSTFKGSSETQERGISNSV